MSVLFDLDIAFLQKLAGSAERNILISSAFLKGSAFEDLCKEVKHDCRNVIITRWQFGDLVSGASDLDAFKLAQKYGWEFFYNQNLHAKLYIFDDHAVIGSSNLTNSGLAGKPPFGNIELSAKLPVDRALSEWFEHLIQNSILVDEELFRAISDDISQFQREAKIQMTIRKGFSHDVLKILEQRNIKQRLFLHDLPATFDPIELLKFPKPDDPAILHDLSVLGLPVKADLDDIKLSFVSSPGFTWMLDKVKTSIYFGELTANLHDDLFDDPKPYRSEVKKRLANLINWASKLSPDHFKIDVPRHSQRINRVG